MSEPTRFTPPSPRVPLMLGCLALFLILSGRAPAAPYTPAIEYEVFFPVAAAGDPVVVRLKGSAAGSLEGAAGVMSWTGSSQSFAYDATPTSPYGSSWWNQGWFYVFLTDAPGVFDLHATADWSAHPDNMSLSPTSCVSTAYAPGGITVVGVTNVIASTIHVAAGGDTITLTAQMTPVNAPEKVYWELENLSGSLHQSGFDSSLYARRRRLLWHGASQMQHNH